MSELTASQLRALRWMDENPSTSAAWTVDGKPLRAKHKPEQWNVMKIEGAQGSILVPVADLKALRSYIVHCASPDRMYGPNEAGRAILAAEAA